MRGIVGSWSHEEEENSTALPSRNEETNVSNTRNLPPSTYLNRPCSQRSVGVRARLPSRFEAS